MARTQVSGLEIEDRSILRIDMEEEFQRVAFEHKVAGWTEVLADTSVTTAKEKMSITTRFERQSGFIKHSGFIKGSA